MLGKERVTHSVNSGISILIAFSGERLDYCSCESLEEILKSVQFDFISLQGAELEENVSIWTFAFKAVIKLDSIAGSHVSFFKLYLFLVKLYKLQYNRVLHVDKKYIYTSNRLIIINILLNYILFNILYLQYSNASNDLVRWFRWTLFPFLVLKSVRCHSWVNLGL